MAIKPYKIKVDLKRREYLTKPTVTQNDDIKFVITVLDYGDPADLTGYTYKLATRTPNKKSFFVDGEKTGDNEITFTLGKGEVEAVGEAKAAVQLWDSQKRQSAIPFTFDVIQDSSFGSTPSPTERSIMELVVQEGPVILAEAEQLIQDNKTTFLPAVDTVSTRDSAYPNPKHGDTVRVTGEAKTYRYVTGSGWVVTDQYNPTAIDNLSAQLAQKAQQVDINKIRSAIDYGQLKMPSDFIDLPCTFYRGFDGRIVHDFDFGKYKTGTDIYVNWETGSDTTGTGSLAQPYQRLSKALEVAASGASNSYVIRLQSKHFPSGATVPNPSVSFTNKNIAVVGEFSNLNTMLSTHERNLTWTLDGADTYKATRSATYAILDLRKKDFNGVPLEVKHVTTLAECQATPNTWYTDNTSIWVHTIDGIVPNDNDFMIGKQVALFDVNLTNSTLYLENVDIVGGKSSFLCSLRGDLSSVLVCRNTKFVGGNLRKNMTGGNSLSVNDIGKTFMFNCVSSLGGRDGFNYHYVNIPLSDRRKCLVIEYNCVSYNHGLYDTNRNNNATTCHEGASILRIGSIGYNTTGPILADVNGCYSICIDCHMKDALDGLTRTKSAYFFDNNGATAPGKAYLINSDGGGNNDSLNSEVGFEVFIKGFRGINIPNDLSLNFIN